MLNAIKSHRRWLTRPSLVLALVVGGALLSSGGALADHKDGHSKGGGGGGGGGDSTVLYSLTDLGAFTGGDVVRSWANAVSDPNADGLAFVAGQWLMSNGDSAAAVWEITETGEVLGLFEIPPLPDTDEYTATDVNSDELVVGRMIRRSANEIPGFVWGPNFGTKELPPPSSGLSHWSAEGINSHGDIVGGYQLWNVDAETGDIIGPVSLGTFYAYDINDDGVMAGSTLDGMAAIAWFDDPGTLQVLELGVLDPQHRGSRSTAINNLDEAVGFSEEPIECPGGGPGCIYPHAFLWTPQDGMMPLGELKSKSTMARDINDFGEIVGTYLWSNGETFKLNDLADTGGKVDLEVARGINNMGQIVGSGLFGKGPNEELHAFLLTPNVQ